MITIYHDDKDRRHRILPYEVVLDNIRSGFNVGSILRNGDAFGCRRFHLLGITAGPDNIQVKKTAKGTEQHLLCQYWHDSTSLLEYLDSQKNPVYALETTDKSQGLASIRFTFPCTIIIGHEVTGVSPTLLENSTQVIAIPMLGIKNSINVSVASGIVFYTLVMQYRESGC